MPGYCGKDKTALQFLATRMFGIGARRVRMIYFKIRIRKALVGLCHCGAKLLLMLICNFNNATDLPAV